MTSRLATPVVGGPAREISRATIRCLHGRYAERRARRLVTEVLARAGVEADLDAVELAVHELVANARQHAPGPYELRIVFRDTSVTIAVMDGGADHAELTRKLLLAAVDRPAEGESGRGLQIVTGLFPGSWGIGPATTCTGRIPAKQVWITIGRSGRAGETGPARHAVPLSGR
jgi:hypothetical protein